MKNIRIGMLQVSGTDNTPEQYGDWKDMRDTFESAGLYYGDSLRGRIEAVIDVLPWQDWDGFSADVKLAKRFMGPTKLLTNSAKLNKGRSDGDDYRTIGLYLPPASSGRDMLRSIGLEVSDWYTLCANATEGCTRACLGTGSGHMNQGVERVASGQYDWDLSNVQRAQAKRLALFEAHRRAFYALFIHEVAAAERADRKAGRQLAVRPNCTSDIAWERKTGFPQIFGLFPDVIWYDYTKHHKRLLAPAFLPRNYTLTYSRADGSVNHDRAEQVLAAGGNVAVVFDTPRKGERGRNGTLKADAALPALFGGVPVIDADLDDARFLDPQGVIVGLRAKGLAKADLTGFVVHTCIAGIKDKAHADARVGCPGLSVITADQTIDAFIHGDQSLRQTIPSILRDAFKSTTSEIVMTVLSDS